MDFCAQSNSLINPSDTAFQSRLLLIPFDPLRDQGADGDDSNLYTDFSCFRELSSALTPDFESILYHDRLDREAIADCAQFMSRALGKRRDRNANMWGVLLYYMLQLNFLMQPTVADVEEIFDWILHTVTGTVYELNKHASVIDQFVLAVHKIRADGLGGMSNPLGEVDKTVFWHNLRNTESGGVQFLCLRVESVLAVIKNVLKKEIPLPVLKAAIAKCDWASVANEAFYDVSQRSWPICRTEIAEDNALCKIPLTETEALLHSKTFPCVQLLRTEVDKIVNSVKLGARLDVDFKQIVVKSSRREEGDYKFFDSTIGGEGETKGWYGYRAAGHSSFGELCGVYNMIPMPHTGENAIIEDVEEANINAGHGTLDDLFTLQTIRGYFSYERYDHDPEDVPPGFLQVAFESRDADDDNPITDPASFLEDGAWANKPPPKFTNTFPKDQYSPRRGRVDDMQSEQETGPALNPGIMGSNLTQEAGSPGQDKSPGGPIRELFPDTDEEVHTPSRNLPGSNSKSPPPRLLPPLA